MGKKQHATQSFTQLVGKANQEALKPFIIEVMQSLGQQLARQQLAATGEVITSIAALKRVLISKGIMTEADFVEARFQEEDAAWGLTESTEAAQAGDFVRITFKAKSDKDEAFGPEDRLNIKRLVEDNTLQPEVAEGIVGMKKGETKEIAFQVSNKVLNEATKQLEDAVTGYVVSVRLDRVSLNPKKPELKAVEKEAAAEEAPASQEEANA